MFRSRCTVRRGDVRETLSCSMTRATEIWRFTMSSPLEALAILIVFYIRQSLHIRLCLHLITLVSYYKSKGNETVEHHTQPVVINMG